MTGDATRRRRLLLIRGLGHSGTTILDLALGAHPQLLGLGEAARILEQPVPGEESRGPAQLRSDLRFERRCTCGAIAAECPVWGDFLEWLPANDGLPLNAKFNHLLAAVEMASSAAPAWFVDSYQGDFQLPFHQDDDLDIRIIHLTRDLRSWVHSRSRDGQRRGSWLPGLRPLLRWCRINARHDRLLQSCGKPVLRLGYEELALEPEKSLQRLCSWLEIPYDSRMLEPSAYSSSHQLAGNRVRFDPKRSGAFRYDGTWMKSPSGLAHLALLMPWVSALNRRLVYASSERSNHS